MTKPQTISIGQNPDQPFPEEYYKELEKFIVEMGDTQGALIEVLHKAQSIFGWLPRDVQLFIARKLGIPAAEVFGVVSFYSYFNTEPKGKHTISVCMGTACFVRGAGEILDGFKEKLRIKTNQITEDGNFSLKDVRCIGACGLSPIVMVDNQVYPRVEKEHLDDIIKTYSSKGLEV
jgi:NADH-quinone oxidoreductase subunit E